MKKVSLVFTFLFVCLQVVLAQNDPQAKDILDRVSVKYSKMNAFKANFVNKFENKEAGVDEEYTGLIFVKDDLIKLATDTRIIFYDGKLIRDYDGDTEEYSIKVPDEEMASLNINSILNLYKSGYKYRIREQDAKSYTIELIPEDKKKSYFKIIMNFSSDFQVNYFTYFEKNGNLVTTEVQNFEELPNLQSKFFDFFGAQLNVIDSVDLR